MNNDETALKEIRNMKPRHAYLIARGLNEVYAFFTDENLENDPNKVLEILSAFSLTETAKKIYEKHYEIDIERTKFEKYNLKTIL